MWGGSKSQAYKVEPGGTADSCQLAVLCVGTGELLGRAFSNLLPTGMDGTQAAVQDLAVGTKVLTTRKVRWMRKYSFWCSYTGKTCVKSTESLFLSCPPPKFPFLQKRFILNYLYPKCLFYLLEIIFKNGYGINMQNVSDSQNLSDGYVKNNFTECHLLSTVVEAII